MPRILLGLVLWLALAPTAHAAGPCDLPYFLPVLDGASWTFRGEPAPRTIQHVQSDSFEVHSSFTTEYQDQPDSIDHVDTYHCGPDGLSLTQHSEIDEAAQGSLFGGLYQGLALPRSIGTGSEWEFSYVTAGGDPTAPPVDQEARDHVTEHFKVLGPGSLTLGNGKQLAAQRVEHTITAIQSVEGVGDSADYSSDQVEWLAEGIGWVSPDLLAYSSGPTADTQCPDQAGQDAALHSTEDGIVNQDAQPDSGDAAEQVMAQAGLTSAGIVAAFGDLGIPADQVSVNASSGLPRFVVRLDGNGRPLQSLAAIDRLVASSCVQPGSLQGAPSLLVGAVQQSGDQVRITARIVDVSTGEIQAADLADGSVGTIDATLRSALGGLPADLGLP
jgi:hypothetical protein